ncbi:glycosyltransferase family 4 protein [Thermorudis peleae]|uniref:glycosyltransferase family 4 protein n=1 Tax=Thermorudis peleae TaxID=1382356 RepID=UPI001E547D3C|nr:glycosyltransferase family 1 protein [Thermorudis peleae]
MFLTMPSPRSLHIGIDASRIGVGYETGTERYARRITEALLALPAPHHFTLFTNQAKTLPFPIPPHAHLRPIPFPRLWTHLRLAIESWRFPLDVLFVPAHVLPLPLRGKGVVTIHDLGFHYEPAAHPWRQRLYLELGTRWSIWRAARIIAISQTTARDLMTIYRVPPEKLSVIPHGIDPHFVPQSPAEQDRVRAKYGLSRPFVLYVGTIQPRKNIRGLLEAFRLLADTHSDLTLVLAGKRGWLADPIFEALAHHPDRERIRFLGYVPEEDLPGLYSAALVFVMSSQYEGFGLPVLEAMACGTPVVASHRGALPEIAGPAILVDALNPQALAQGIQDALCPERRPALIAAGLKHVKRFTWEAAARATLAVLEAAAQEG